MVFVKLSDVAEVCKREDYEGIVACQREIARLSIIAELDAINLYEQMADMTGDPNLRDVLLDVAREEKVHVGEFLFMLKGNDVEQLQSIGEGEREVSKDVLEKSVKKG